MGLYFAFELIYIIPFDLSFSWAVVGSATSTDLPDYRLKGLPAIKYKTIRVNRVRVATYRSWITPQFHDLSVQGSGILAADVRGLGNIADRCGRQTLDGYIGADGGRLKVGMLVKML